jgi:hypothetical protein
LNHKEKDTCPFYDRFLFVQDSELRMSGCSSERSSRPRPEPGSQSERGGPAIAFAPRTSAFHFRSAFYNDDFGKQLPSVTNADGTATRVFLILKNDADGQKKLILVLVLSGCIMSNNASVVPSTWCGRSVVGKKNVRKILF